MCSACWDGVDKHRERNVYREEDEYETPHRKPGGKRKRNKPKVIKGCPANDRKAHVYVWIEYFGKRRDWWTGVERVRETHWYEKTCVGCGHVTNRRWDWGFLYRKSEPSFEVYTTRHVDHDGF